MWAEPPAGNQVGKEGETEKERKRRKNKHTSFMQIICYAEDEEVGQWSHLIGQLWGQE